MKNLFISALILLSLHAENNITKESNSSIVSNESNITAESNSSKSNIETNNTKVDNAAKALQEQMEREKKFAKEQTFYQGDEYDLSYAEVNQDSLDSVPLIEPEYDFNMDDVYN